MNSRHDLRFGRKDYKDPPTQANPAPCHSRQLRRQGRQAPLSGSEGQCCVTLGHYKFTTFEFKLRAGSFDSLKSPRKLILEDLNGDATSKEYGCDSVAPGPSPWRVRRALSTMPFSP